MPANATGSAHISFKLLSKENNSASNVRSFGKTGLYIVLGVCGGGGRWRWVVAAAAELSALGTGHWALDAAISRPARSPSPAAAPRRARMRLVLPWCFPCFRGILFALNDADRWPLAADRTHRALHRGGPLFIQWLLLGAQFRSAVSAPPRAAPRCPDTCNETEWQGRPKSE